MAEVNQQLKVIGVLAANEELISKLYKLYAKLIPELQDFWEDLAKEETRHAYWILALQTHINDGVLSFKENRFNLRAIELFLIYVKDLLDTAKGRVKAPKDALANAMNIENALIERKFFEVFNEDSPALKDTLQQLVIATEKHREKISAEFSKY